MDARVKKREQSDGNDASDAHNPHTNFNTLQGHMVGFARIPLVLAPDGTAISVGPPCPCSTVTPFLAAQTQETLWHV